MSAAVLGVAALIGVGAVLSAITGLSLGWSELIAVGAFACVAIPLARR